jgi:hypothetical protein
LTNRYTEVYYKEARQRVKLTPLRMNILAGVKMFSFNGYAGDFNLKRFIGKERIWDF